MNIFRQSELSQEEAGDFEARLRHQGFREAWVRCEAQLLPREYCKVRRPLPVENLFGGAPWTISWRP